MKGPDAHPLHQLFLLTAKVGTWPAWKAVPVGLAPMALPAWLWARMAGRPALGWALALILLILSAADWGLLATLPRRRLSFGPVPAPWLLLVLLRCGLALIAIPLAGRWPLPALAGMALVQVGVWVLAAYGMVVEPLRLRVGTASLVSPKLSNPGTPLRIVQLSDLHVERLTRRERALPALVAGLEPDLILLTGDYLSTSYNKDPQAVSELRTLLAQFHAPGGVYAIWGTAQVDYPLVLRSTFADLGIKLLEDQVVPVSVGGHELRLIGLACYRDLAAGGARLHDLLTGVPQQAFTILLHHTPDLMPHASAQCVDLVLAGHTHGGQWCVPGFGALYTGSRYWKRYESGLRHERNTHLYVSRGLGMEGYGVPRARFFCPPEVVLLTVSGLQPSAVSLPSPLGHLPALSGADCDSHLP